MDKRLGSSDWNKNLDELSDAQLQYCSNDVIYLHKIKNALHKMLVRENRTNIAKACFDFIEHRTKLDLMGWDDLDIFRH